MNRETFVTDTHAIAKLAAAIFAADGERARAAIRAAEGKRLYYKGTCE